VSNTPSPGPRMKRSEPNHSNGGFFLLDRTGQASASCTASIAVIGHYSSNSMRTKTSAVPPGSTPPDKRKTVNHVHTLMHVSVCVYLCLGLRRCQVANMNVDYMVRVTFEFVLRGWGFAVHLKIRLTCRAISPSRLRACARLCKETIIVNTHASAFCAAGRSPFPPAARIPPQGCSADRAADALPLGLHFVGNDPGAWFEYDGWPVLSRCASEDTYIGCGLLLAAVDSIPLASHLDDDCCMTSYCYSLTTLASTQQRTTSSTTIRTHTSYTMPAATFPPCPGPPPTRPLPPIPSK
jgi:hypothetical protein